ncbi:efflux RND transporter periplasmic adaptor subunit [Pseudoalteromonas luteoviolacea]|uniref:efflux RND transporter periplasmic adaptor subunit n=1 Tax=Pseudoalteromonas luteoviolacea TaxID=43657 RepID=UPI0011507D16|nr:efflux RND transporter periplasmic adaptor subunit [Pseudoalteromonas luteoviolacea]TQF70428.1 efflux RND transporter periplasmic adaptor subunit [Pseudoalteromonas luteoviolacea]
MNPVKKIVLPAAVLVVSILLVMFITSNPPKAKRGQGKPQAQMTVDFQTVSTAPFTMKISSYGVVQPRTQSMLVAQVSGEISEINDNFRDGGFFEKGELLLRIDDRDYHAEVQVAKATLLSAQQGLIEEEARGKQAEVDWQRLGDGSEPSDLVLRKPQLAAQRANVLSAQAQLAKAELALERTQIIAPFAGRILSKKVDLGQVISTNSQLAQIYAIDYVEVRLPINNRDLAFLTLPEQSREGTKHGDFASVLLSSDLGVEQQWVGKIVRTEGAINELSQQLYVVAQIDDPYSMEQQDNFAIKIGQYVNARIAGRTIKNAITIPNSAIYQGSYVYVLDDNDLLMRQEITLAWQSEENAIVKSGLSNGMRLVTTPLGQVSSGTRVAVMNRSPDNKTKDAKSWEQLSEKQQRRVQKIAKERGVTVDQVMAERRDRAQEKGI